MRRSTPKDPFQRAQDFAAAIAITTLIIGFAIGIALAHLAGSGHDCGGR